MFEYKVVPAPVRAQKIKGLKTTQARFAQTLAQVLNAEAAGGWQFVRSETLPCEERSTLGAIRQSNQTMLVFARPLPQDDAEPAQDWGPEPVWAPEPARAPEPQWQTDEAEAAAPPVRREPLFRAGSLMREAPTRAEPVLRPRRPADDEGYSG